jgi:hypothetical protein
VNFFHEPFCAEDIGAELREAFSEGYEIDFDAGPILFLKRRGVPVRLH